VTELKALKIILARAKQVSDADSELEEALRIFERLIKKVEYAETAPVNARYLSEEVMYEIGNIVVGYVTADAVRCILEDKGFSGPARNLTTGRIADMLYEQMTQIGCPGYLDWEYTVQDSGRPSADGRSWIKWPEDENT